MGSGSRSVGSEFKGVRLGDKRLEDRCAAVVEALEAQPDASFPNATGSDGALEGLYRFLSNDNVSFEALFEPHRQQTIRRAAEQREILVAHDSSSFIFGGDSPRKGLGKVGTKAQGFLGHFSLAVSADERRDPLGMLAARTWVRRGPTATSQRKGRTPKSPQAPLAPSERRRWLEQMREVEGLTRNLGISAIHVADSEADDLKVIAPLVAEGCRFVVRLCQDRRLAEEETGCEPNEKLRSFVSKAEVVGTRDIHLSRRGRLPGGGHKRDKPRQARSARLEIRARHVVVRRPLLIKDPISATLACNVIQVREVDAPPDVEPIEWLLATSEPIETREQILQVIDWYRSRWLIEEYFKALKTGCAFESRQLESKDGLTKALALFIPIAWTLLRLRTLARTDATGPAEVVLAKDELIVLRRAVKKPLRFKPTVEEVWLAVASLGGHLKNNGAPGWQVLGRGYEKLMLLTAGYRLATSTSVGA